MKLNLKIAKDFRWIELNEDTYMLWLSNFVDISLKIKLELLKYFKTAENVFNANLDELNNSNVSNFKIYNIILSSKNINDVLSYKSVILDKGIKFVHLNDECYPKLLKHIYDPPIVLYYKGRFPTDKCTYVSFVGTRRCSNYGKSATFKLVSDLCRYDIAVVSGLADGIDKIAHQSALKAGMFTVAVLGTAIDECYPKGNISLMNEIAQNGLIISEYPPNTKTYPSNFPRRNRIIAGISKATIVTEAPIKSGALITASLALDFGREVLTIPANIFEKTSEGNNELIKDGAYVVTSYKDILYAVGIDENSPEIEKSSVVHKTNTVAKLTEDESLLLKCFLNYETTIEELLNNTDFDISKIQTLLTMLEYKDVIMKLPGQKYMKK